MIKIRTGIIFTALIAAIPAFGLESEGGWFMTLNPAAAVSFIGGQSDTGMGFFTGAVLPVFANLESGVSMGGGYCGNARFIEGRLSLGNSNGYLFVLQAQAGYFFQWQEKGVYAGASLRYMDIVNLNTGIHNQDILPLASLGYWLDFSGFFLDIRMSQMFVILSWSSMPHTVPAICFAFSPLTAISPYMPLLLISAGYRF
jgi:hypothetical protein